MKCINRSHPEFKRNAEEAARYGVGTLAFEFMATTWQNDNDTDVFPSIGQLNKKLENLFNVMNDLGISLRTIDWYQEVTGTAVGADVNALADPIRKVIAFKQGKLNVQDLAEEIMHIVMAHSDLSGDYEFQRALKYVEDTPEYAENAELYRKKYKDENKVKKEILAQIAGKVLLRSQERKGDNALVRMLKRIWDKFLAIFDNRAKLDNYLQKLAGDPVLGTKTPVDKGIYFSLVKEQMRKDLRDKKIKVVAEVQLQKAIDEAATEEERNYLTGLKDNMEDKAVYSYNGKFYTEDTLEAKIATEFPDTIATDEEFTKKINKIKEGIYKRKGRLERRGRWTESRKQQYEKQVASLNKEKDALKRGEGLVEFLTYVKEDASKLRNFLKDVTRKITPETIVEIGEFYSYYEPLIQELNQYLRMRQLYASDLSMFPSALLPKIAETELLNLSSEVIHLFNETKADIAGPIFQQTVKIMREFYKDKLRIDSNDLKEIDNQINQSLFPNGGSYIEQLERLSKDISSLDYWTGSGKDVNNSTIRVVHSILMDIASQTEMEQNNFAKDFLEQAKSFGFKDYEFAMEKDADGKVTGYIVGEIKKGEFKRNLADKQAEMHKKYNIPDEFNERRIWKENMRDLDKKPSNMLLESEKKDLSKFKDYNQEWAVWWQKNTVPRRDAEELMKAAKDELSEVEYDEWVKRNVGTSYHKGQVFTYWKGDMVVPSDGRVKHDADYGDIKTVDYTNPQWSKLTSKQKDFVEFYKQTKVKFDDIYPGKIDSDMLIPLREDMMGIVLHRNKNILNRFGYNIKDVIVTDAEDSTLFGEEDEFDRAAGNIIFRDAPIHHTRVLENPDAISRDLLGTMIEYSRVAFNYKNKKPLVSKLHVVEEQMKNIIVLKKGKEIKGEQSNTYKRFSNLLEMLFQDRMKIKQEVEIFGKKINVTKAVEKFTSYAAGANLLLQIGTIFSSTAMSRLQTLQESLMGYYINSKDYKASITEYWKQVHKTGMDGFNKASKAKLNVLAENAGVIEATKQYDRSYALRKGKLWLPYTLPSSVMATQLIIALTRNVRMDSNGNWHTKELYKGNENWDKMPNLYDSITISSNGGMNIPAGAQKEWNHVASKARNLVARVEGKINQTDKAWLHQHHILSAMTMHRNWFIGGLWDRLKQPGYNFVTDRYEQGYWRANSWTNVRSFVKGAIFRMKEDLSRWESLSEEDKYGVRMTAMDIAKLIAMIGVALIVHGVADDDEELEILSYLTNRMLLEVGAFYNPTEYATVLTNPFTPLKYLEYTADFMDIFSGQEVERGPYKGYSQREKYILRMIPGVRGWHTSRNPQAANQFLMNKPLRIMPWELAE